MKKTYNNPNLPKANHIKSGPPKDTSDGASLKTGYKVVTAKGMSPRAVAQNK